MLPSCCICAHSVPRSTEGTTRVDHTSPHPHLQGCYTVILNAFETYVYLAGALAIGVLAIEVSVARLQPCTHGAVPNLPVSTFVAEDPEGSSWGPVGVIWSPENHDWTHDT